MTDLRGGCRVPRPGRAEGARRPEREASWRDGRSRAPVGVSRPRWRSGVAAGAAVGLGSAEAHRKDHQPVLSSRSAPIITVDRLKFRDLDRNGALTPYEDWRLSPRQRATDLLGRMSLEQKAGLLVHGTLPDLRRGLPGGRAGAPDRDRHMSTFITRLAAAPDTLATANNSVQELAEQQPLGIPAVISSDPRNGFSVTAGQTVPRVGHDGDAGRDRVRRRGEPRADPAPDRHRAPGVPRRRHHGGPLAAGRSRDRAALDPHQRHLRLGSRARSSARSQAYVAGLQGGTRASARRARRRSPSTGPATARRPTATTATTTTGASRRSRAASSRSTSCRTRARSRPTTAGIMPTYSILKDLVYQGHAVPQVGGGFNTLPAPGPASRPIRLRRRGRLGLRDHRRLPRDLPREPPARVVHRPVGRRHAVGRRGQDRRRALRACRSARASTRSAAPTSRPTSSPPSIRAC